jgi:hypothetical protein
MGLTYTKRSARSARDAFRLTIGDTDASDPLLSDEEADYYLGNNGDDAVLAAAEACEALAARFARDAVIAAADLERSPASKAETYLKLARQLMGRAGEEKSEPRSSRLRMPERMPVI